MHRGVVVAVETNLCFISPSVTLDKSYKCAVAPLPFSEEGTGEDRDKTQVDVALCIEQ